MQQSFPPYSVKALADTLRQAVGRVAMLRNALLLVGGTAAAQLLNLAAMPVLTRLYSPEAFGVYGAFIAVATFATVGVSLRYEAAIVSATTSRSAAYLVALSTLLCLPLGVLLSAAMYALTAFGIAGFDVLPPVVALLVLPCVLLTALFANLRYWLVREGAFRSVARVTVVQSAWRVGAQIGLVLATPGGYGLVVGELVGRASGLGSLFRHSYRALRADLFPFRRKMLAATAHRFRDFPQYNLPSMIVDAAALALPLPLIAGIYGAGAAGFFALTQRVLQIPLNFVGRSVADAFHAHAAEAMREKSTALTRIYLRTAFTLLALGLAPALLLMAFGEMLFGRIFGAEWNQAGVLAATMAPWALAQFVVSPLSRIVLVAGGQRKKLFFDFGSLIAVFAPILIGEARGLSLVTTVQLLSLCQVLAYIGYFFLLLQITHKSERALPCAVSQA